MMSKIHQGNYFNDNCHRCALDVLKIRAHKYWDCRIARRIGVPSLAM